MDEQTDELFRQYLIIVAQHGVGEESKRFAEQYKSNQEFTNGVKNFAIVKNAVRGVFSGRPQEGESSEVLEQALTTELSKRTSNTARVLQQQVSHQNSMYATDLSQRMDEALEENDF